MRLYKVFTLDKNIFQFWHTFIISNTLQYILVMDLIYSEDYN